MSEPRAKTADEVRAEVIDHLLGMARYWAKVEGQTDLEKCEGVIHSVLVMFDGCSSSLPAFNLVVCPHEDDKEYCIEHGENWYEPGMVINDSSMMHDEFNAIR